MAEPGGSAIVVFTSQDATGSLSSHTNDSECWDLLYAADMPGLSDGRADPNSLSLVG